MANIIIADDHQIFRESLALMLEKHGYKVLLSAFDGKHLLESLKTHKPDLIILDIAMPEMDGYEAARQIMNSYPEIKILVLSAFGEEKYYYKMIQTGVKGFILKKAGIIELEQAINEILAGGSWFSTELLQRLIISVNKKKTDISGLANLTEREIEVLNLICKGLTAEEIGNELFLSPETIRSHRSSLLSKTGCNNSPALVLWAIKNKYIDV